MPTANRQEYEKLEAAAKGGYAVFGLPEQMPDQGGSFDCTIVWEDGELGGATDFWFSWSGDTDYVDDNSVSFRCVMAQGQPGLSVMSSVAMVGVAHWLAHTGHLLVAWWNVDEDQGHGWGVLPDGASTRASRSPPLQ
jgi:hypothetical protein